MLYNTINFQAQTKVHNVIAGLTQEKKKLKKNLQKKITNLTKEHTRQDNIIDKAYKEKFSKNRRKFLAKKLQIT
ncbi:MAG: hypothetical protein OXK80_04330 [Bdellovibrionales bacterium]|nr:hypothetical protein [Bdellovibrionales bacterium]